MNLTWDVIVKAARKLVEGLTFAQKAFLFIVSTVALTGLILLLVWSGNTQYRVLFSNLGNEQASLVIAELNDVGVPYELSQAGTTISVPYDRVDELRIRLVSAGVVPSGEPKGYELFDEFKIGVPESIQLVNKKRALEGELARTIKSIRGVKRAIVHLTPARRSPYRGKEKPAKASVVVELVGGMDPSDKISGIAHLIAGAVEDLAMEDVTVLDGRGNVLSQTVLEAGMSVVSRQLQVQKEIETYRAQKAQTMLDNVLGLDKATIRVSAQLDFRKTESTVETFDPDGQVLRSEIINKSESSTPSAGGATGAAARLGGLPSQGSANTNDTNERKVEYENSKTVQRTVEDGVIIKRLSISLIVDESLSAKVQDLESIVKNAVGFEEDRGDTFDAMVTTFPAAEEPPPPPGIMDQIDLMEMVRYGTVVFSFLFAFLMIRFLIGKSKKALKIDTPTPVLATAGAQARLEGPEDGGERAVMKEEVARVIEQDPVEASRLLQSWLEDEE